MSESIGGSQISIPEIFYGSASSSDSESQIEIDVNTRGEVGERNYSVTHTSGTISSARRSCSSSLSDSSSEPDSFFGIDGLNFTASDAPALVSKCESSAKSENDNSPQVPPSTDQLYNSSYKQKGMLPTACPPMQVMDRSGGYRSRIPSSIFETNAAEWSVASNDSLFSIHLAQSSFRGEFPFLFDEFVMPEDLTKSVEPNVFNQTPPIIVEEIDSASIKDDTETLQTTRTSDESFKSGQKLSKDGDEIKDDTETLQTIRTSDESFKSDQKLSKDGDEIKSSHQHTIYKSPKSDLSEFSNGSGSSVPPFVSLKKRSRSSRASCCYKWSSCKCLSCGWAFCCCWNCSHTKCCGCASFDLTETDGNSFMKTDIPRHKQESETSSSSSSSCCSCFRSKEESEVTSKPSAGCCGWFRCFCCPYCSCSSCACKPYCSNSWNHCCPYCPCSSCACKPSCTWKFSCTSCC